MEKPLVSIIMGAYNAGNTISACIDSIIAQTYTNWELIICNDCSKDNTEEILEEYKNRDGRIVVIKNETNMRLAASLNRCLEISNGKYVARMDADDESMTERLSKEVEFMEEHPEYDVVGCSCVVFDEHGNLGVRKSDEHPTKDILYRDTPFAHPTILMKKSVYDALGGYTVDRTTMRAEDLDLWFRFYELGFAGYNLQNVLYRYRESTSDFGKRTVKAGIQTAKVFWKGYKKVNIPWRKRIWVFKPIIMALIPNELLKHIYAKRMQSPVELEN